jgi:hypothetical protein
MLAAIAKTPELELSEEEAAKLAKASLAVAKQYNVETTAKAAAWANLAGCIGGIYVPRLMAANFRKKAEAAQRKSGNAGVVNFPGAPPMQPRPN